MNGDGERDWLVVECDGLPYLLAKTVIYRSQIEAQKQALKEAGIPATSSLKGPELKQELQRRGLDTRGRVEDLRCRLQHAVDKQLRSGEIALPSKAKGEYDWVVLRSGGLHWEMKLLQCVVEVLWPMVYQAFAESQGYTTERQQEWAKSCRDHHRAYDELSRFVDGTFQELLFPYVRASTNPTPQGFFEWAKQFAGNKTYSLLLELTTRCAFGVFVFRHGVRHNKYSARLLGKRAVSPLLHARHFPNYQLIDLFSEEDELSYPEDIRDFFTSFSSLSR